MDLLQNAIQSICAGVEDFQTGEHARLLTAIRNIHAGILLLYKEKLRRLSPTGSDEVLIKARVKPKLDANGAIIFVGVSKNTVDVQQIRERFESLGITTDWTRFDRISKVRNDLEHYYSGADKKSLEGLISDAFVIMRDFVTTELGEDPRALLGEETWQEMLQISDVLEAERKECRKALEAVDWKSEALAEGVLTLSCPACSGSLLRPDGTYASYTDEMGLECRGCGEIATATDFVPRAISEALAADAYLAYKDGGEEPYTSCPECSFEAYVLGEDGCAYCGASVDRECSRCGNEIPASELDCAPLCGYCEHMTSKDD